MNISVSTSNFWKLETRSWRFSTQVLSTSIFNFADMFLESETDFLKVSFDSSMKKKFLTCCLSCLDELENDKFNLSAKTFLIIQIWGSDSLFAQLDTSILFEKKTCQNQSFGDSVYARTIYWPSFINDFLWIKFFFKRSFWSEICCCSKINWEDTYSRKLQNRNLEKKASKKLIRERHR